MACGRALPLALCLVVAGLVGPRIQLPALAVTATLSITPDSGPPLTKTEIQGTGFAPNEEIRLSFDSRHMDMAKADDQGVFVAERHVPFDILPGDHPVQAMGEESGLRAGTQFIMWTEWPRYQADDRGTGNKEFENVLTPSTVAGLREVWTAPTSCCYVAPV